MKGSAFLFALALVIVAASPARSQVVQLPTFSQFSVSTTVMVPDSGGVMLGGIDSAREGANEFGFGPFRDRGIGREFHSSRLSATASIIDLHEMDEMTLAKAGSGTPVDLATLEKADRVIRGISQTTDRGIMSVSALKRERAEKVRAQQAEVLKFVERGDAMQQQGKFSTAKTFYRMALKRTSDNDLRKDIALKIAQLEKQ
jgi:hypothetical protein